MRILLISFIFLSGAALFAQRDTTIDEKKLHYYGLNSGNDTAFTVWITDVKNFSGNVCEVWLNGNIRSKGVMFKGEKSGVWDRYYYSGTLASHGYYKRGLEDGVWTYYYPSGKVYASGNYSNGQKDGLWRTYYESGKDLSRGQYWHNCCTGTWQTWYEDGKLRSWSRYHVKTEWEKRKKTFVVDRMDRRGRSGTYLARRFYFKASDSIVEYYPNGKLRSRILFGDDGVIEGKAQFWYANGNLNREELYKEGRPVGCWLYFCENGLLVKWTQNEGEPCVAPETENNTCNYPGDLPLWVQPVSTAYPYIRAKF